MMISGRTHIFDYFHKMFLTRFQACRTALIRSALETPDPDAFNDGSNVGIRSRGTDLVTFEVGWLPNKSELSEEIFVNLLTILW